MPSFERIIYVGVTMTRNQKIPFIRLPFAIILFIKKPFIKIKIYINFRNYYACTCQLITVSGGVKLTRVELNAYHVNRL